MEFRRMLLWLGFAACVLIVPWIGLWADRYEHVDAFPYGAYVHSVATYGKRAFLLTVAVGFFGLLLGLFRPALVIRGDAPTRGRVWLIYGAMFPLAFLVWEETHHLAQRVYAAHPEVMQKVFNGLQAGMPLEEMSLATKGVDRNIVLGYQDATRYGRTIGFPYRKQQMLVAFHYPSLAPHDKVLVQMSAAPRSAGAVAERILLMKGDRLVKANPVVTSTEVQVYRGLITLQAEGDLISLCGSEERLLLKLPGDVRERMVANQKYLRRSKSGDKQVIPRFAAFIGERSTIAGRVQEESYTGVLTMLEWRTYGNASTTVGGDLMMGVDPNGKRQPWGCLY